MSNRIEKTLKMLEILRDGRRYKKQELADMLDTKPRNIIEYKKDLEASGYYIDYQNGKNGGYALDTECLLPSINFTIQEKTALLRANDYIQSSDFLLNEDFNEAMIKLKANFNIDDVNYSTYLGTARIKDKEIIDRYYKIISEAIKERKKIKIQYRSLQNMHNDTYIESVYCPYELIFHQGFWYVIVLTDKKKKDGKLLNFHDRQRFLKLSAIRMKDVSILEDQPFYRDEEFNLKEHTGQVSIGRFEQFEIELKVTGPTAILVSEKIVGIDPEYIWEDDNTLILKTNIEGKFTAFAFILSLGANATLLGPKNLVDEFKTIVDKMGQLYKDKKETVLH